MKIDCEQSAHQWPCRSTSRSSRNYVVCSSSTCQVSYCSSNTVSFFYNLSLISLKKNNNKKKKIKKKSETVNDKNVLLAQVTAFMVWTQRCQRTVMHTWRDFHWYIMCNHSGITERKVEVFESQRRSWRYWNQKVPEEETSKRENVSANVPVTPKRESYLQRKM
jgi:hypothetical protein